jgi:ppGpp synthetase/RelA/SpoT-type nucleotidyltranferase
MDIGLFADIVTILGFPMAILSLYLAYKGVSNTAEDINEGIKNINKNLMNVDQKMDNLNSNINDQNIDATFHNYPAQQSARKDEVDEDE